MSNGRPPGDSPIVVSGIGLATGLGPSRVSTWQGIREGRSAVRILDWPADPGGPPYLGAPIPGPPEVIGPDAPEPVFTILRRVASEAFRDARLDPLGIDLDRTGVLLGLSKGGIRSMGRVADALKDPAADADAIGRLWQGACWPNVGASYLSAWLGSRGPCMAPVAACATGLVAVLRGVELIRSGECDLVLAGSVDSSLEPLLLGAFRKMRALARPDADQDPASAVRPWDRGRSGFVVGEGGAVLVLERAEHAIARGVQPYAQIAGGALGSDAHHETGLNPDPRLLAGLITRALERSNVNPDELDHVNVHGTATRDNDPLECGALRLALGSRFDRIRASANKSQIGHLLGAAGSAELAIACLSIRDGFVPPTLNLRDPDPACVLPHTPTGESRPIRSALKLSLGFGGHLAAAVLVGWAPPTTTSA